MNRSYDLRENMLQDAPESSALRSPGYDKKPIQNLILDSFGEKGFTITLILIDCEKKFLHRTDHGL